jgi:hypothetical protein
MVKPVGLKASLPALAGILGETRISLQERQKLLVAEGLLETVPGHGPGSGVRLSPQSVAMLLIGCLAAVNMGQLGPRARAIAETTMTPACGLTGATTFADALTRLIADEAMAARVTAIKVAVTHGYALIEFDRGSSEFKGPMPMKTEIGLLSTERGLSIEIAIATDTIRALSAAVAGQLHEKRKATFKFIVSNRAEDK